MKPLQAVGLGLVLLALGPADAAPGTFDPLPDPLGWFLVLVGLHGLGPALDPRRLPTLRFVGALALVVSAAMVVPAVARWLETDPSLGWSADVPVRVRPRRAVAVVEVRGMGSSCVLGSK